MWSHRAEPAWDFITIAKQYRNGRAVCAGDSYGFLYTHARYTAMFTPSYMIYSAVVFCLRHPPDVPTIRLHFHAHSKEETST